MSLKLSETANLIVDSETGSFEVDGQWSGLKILLEEEFHRRDGVHWKWTLRAVISPKARGTFL